MSNKSPQVLFQKIKLPWVQADSIILALILLLALILRLPHLAGSFWLDEAAQALQSVRPFSQQLQISADFQPPLLHVLTHFASRVDQSEWWLRLWGAVIPGLLTIAAVYQIGIQHLKSRQTAIIASLLLTTSSLHMFFSQELRPYALPAALASWSWLVLLGRAADKPILNWKYVVLSALGLYSSYLYPFVLLGQLGYAFFRRVRIQTMLLAYGSIGLLFAPWLPYFLEQLQVGGALRTTLPGWDQVVSNPQWQALPLVGAKFVYGVLSVDILGWHSVVALLLGVLLFLTWWQHRSRPVVRTIMRLFVWWVIIPIGAAWLISFIIPVIQPKRVLFALPGVYLGLAVLATSSWTLLLQSKKKSGVLRYAGLALVLLLFSINVFSLMGYYSDPTLQRENWRSLYENISQDYPSGAVALMAFSEPFAPWIWYNTDKYPTLSTERLLVSDRTQIEPLIKQIYDQYQYVLLFEYLQDLTDPERLLQSELERYDYRETAAYDAGAIGFVRVYSRPEAVLSYY